MSHDQMGLAAMREHMSQLDGIIDENMDELKHAHIYEKINQVNERIDHLQSQINHLARAFARLDRR